MTDNLSGQAGLDAIARLICDFMNWPEDGPAWDDAHKLARQVHEPAYKQGWSDRDADILERAERILPAEESSAKAHGLAICTTDCFECGRALEGPWCPACNPPTPWRPDREAVARIIDPHNWSLWNDDGGHLWGDRMAGRERVRADSLAKADAILALAPAEARSVEPRGDS